MEERNNCIHCGTGKHWWFSHSEFPNTVRKAHNQCPKCEGDPLDPMSPHLDQEQMRVRMIKMFGVRGAGDSELLELYYPNKAVAPGV